MEIKFDTQTLGRTDANALRALLDVLHGSAAPTVAEVVAAHAPEPGAAILTPAAPASDGYPTDAPPPPPAPDGEIVGPGATDIKGIPWDERIHSSTKGTNKDGTWSRRRNTPDATFDAVMAELKGGTAPTEATAEEAFAAPTVPAPPAPVPPPPAADPAAGPISFPNMMVKITRAQTAGKITKADVDGFLGSFGLKSVAELAPPAMAETRDAIAAMVDGHVGA